MNNIHFNKNKQKIVQEVFESSSSNYDLMNDLMSLGSHRLWKSKMIENINFDKSDVIIDVASGTGDLSKYILKKNQKQKMLNKNTRFFKNFPNVSAIKSVAENLPIDSNSIDIYLISFGLRNLVNIDHSLSEAYRVLKTGGQFCCMEFYKVKKPIVKELYSFYSNIIPLLGKIVNGDSKPYKYLNKSIEDFFSQDQISKKLTKNKFSNIYKEDLLSGILSIHHAWKLK